VEVWRKRAERIIWNADDAHRKQIMKEGNIYLGADQEETAKMNAAWQKGLDSTLPAETQEKLKAKREEQKIRRSRAWSRVLIAELDARVAFTLSQRERLGPVVESLVARHASAPPERDHQIWDAGIPISVLYTAGSQASEEQLRTILDEVQWKRWQNACKNKGNDGGTSRVARLFNDPGEASSNQPSAEPEELEGLISDYLAEKVTGERSRALNAMKLKAEDAARVTNISPATLERLQTAALGAIENSLDDWKAGLYEAVRPYANAGTVQTVAQRLANIQDYRLNRSMGTTPEQQPLWLESLKRELTTEQRDAWQTEIRHREAYREAAIAAGLLEAFANKVQLDDTQMAKLEQLLAKIMSEYGEDIRGMFSSSTSWYLQRYYMFLPFAGIPEAEMKSVLTKEQWETWIGSNEHNGANNYWENIKRMHEQRSKTRK
jgi:hypothetical protein